MRILIVYNTNRFNGLEIATKASELLVDAGAETQLLEFSSNDIDDFDFSIFHKIVAIGGDGTIIKIAKLASQYKLPVIGVNAGRLGYLASVDLDMLGDITKIVTDNCSVEERMMLTADIYRDKKLVMSCDGLNDIVISKSSVATMLDIDVKVNNDVITYRADGFITATPTGSTAYSMSAGGPVVDPSVDCMVLTAVCPHTLMNRSVIVGVKTDVSVSVRNADNLQIVLSADGRAVCDLDDKCVVKIKKSNKTVSFIKLSDVSVYKIFSEKTKVE